MREVRVNELLFTGMDIDHMFNIHYSSALTCRVTGHCLCGVQL